MFFMLSKTVFGIDFNENMMRNDHDTLLIGMIISIDEDEVVIQAVDYIVSAYDLTEGATQRQLRPDIVTVANDERMNGFRVNDYVLASLNQEDDLFVVAWGIYRLYLVYELDWQMWRVETDDLVTSVILSDFVNQEGRYTYSVREDGTIIRHQADAEIVIYDPDPPTEIQPREDDEAEEVEGNDVDESETDAQELEETSHTPMLVIAGLTSVTLAAVVVWLLHKKSKSK